MSPSARQVAALLRPDLERVRLELRALFRALDQLQVAQSLPRQLRALMELDADLGEALWVLQQPPGRFDLRALTKDTRASLARVPGARAVFLSTLDEPTRLVVEGRAELLRRTLVPEDAYRDLPGTR